MTEEYSMTKKKNETATTTYDRVIEKMSPSRKKKFDEKYRELVFSELLIALMKEDDISVGKLALETVLLPSSLELSQ